MIAKTLGEENDVEDGDFGGSDDDSEDLDGDENDDDMRRKVAKNAHRPRKHKSVTGGATTIKAFRCQTWGPRAEVPTVMNMAAKVGNYLDNVHREKRIKD